MYFLSEALEFPNPELATKDGLLAVGGDLTPARLLLAYQSGIFPWYDDKSPILWWSPDPRMVLFLEKFKRSKSLQKTIDQQKFEITFNTAFSEVISNCARTKRAGQNGTWITPEMKAGYTELHRLGHAQSVEVWMDGTLVGGLYGIDLPNQKIFCGESMFSKVSNASKVGFYHLIKRLKVKKYRLIDCQVYTKHLASLGAEGISRKSFLALLKT